MLLSRQLQSANVVWTDASLGNFAHRFPDDETCCGDEVNERRKAIHPNRWWNVRQVHETGVVHVDEELQRAHGHDRQRRLEADALVTTLSEVPLAIATADCAPIALASVEGVIAAVHAGWAGLFAGVIPSAVAAMRALGASDIRAALGPCIHVECCEFGTDHLEKFVERWGESVHGVTAKGSPAFDLPAAVATELASVEVDLEYVDHHCTACSGEYFSYRVSKTADRQVMLVWK